MRDAGNESNLDDTMSNRRLSIFAIAIGGCFVMAVLLVQGRSSSTPEVEVASFEAPVRAVTAKVALDRVLLIDELPGRVVAFKRVEIRPQVGGIIKKKLVEGGSRVEAGKILFEIEPALFLADVEIARAALTRAESAVEHARAGFERAEALLASKAGSRKNYEDARNNLTTAQANLAEARAVFLRRQLDLDFATIRSPIDGYVGRTVADQGSLASISGQTELAVVQQLDQVYVDLRLPATKLSAVKSAAQQGVGPIVILDAEGKPYPGPAKLVLSDVTVDIVTGNATVRVLVDNPEVRLLPGMFVRARVPRGLLSDAILVPENALVRTGETEASIIVVGADGHAKRRNVTLGDAVGGRVVVTSGLNPGDTIVVRGQDHLQDGAVVNAVDSQNAATVKDKI